MSIAKSRLAKIASQILPTSVVPQHDQAHNIHQLSPTYFLPRAAAIEPDVRTHPSIPLPVSNVLSSPDHVSKIKARTSELCLNVTKQAR